MAAGKSKREKNNIHRTLLTNYLLTMLAALVLVIAIITVWQISTLRKSVNSGLQQACNTVVINVDKEIQKMDSISINILYSNLVKETFAQYSNYDRSGAPSSNRRAYENNSNAERLTNMLLAIMGADRPVRQINLYNLDAGCFGTGIYTGRMSQNATDQVWYKPTADRLGYKYIPLPEKKPELSQEAGTSADRYYISLVRQFYDSFNRPEGFVEIIQYYDAVFATAIDPESVLKPKVIIYNQEGSIIFPAQTDEDLFYDYLPFRREGLVQLNNPLSGRREFAVFGDMQYAGFTAVVVVESRHYFAPIFQFLLWMIAFLIFVTILCCLTAYYVTRRLSAPIVGMYSYLSTLNFDSYDWLQIPMLDSGILEIDVLRDSIDQFQQQLKISTDNIILLQKHDMQSQMLALQSQMNPHFLYNSLANVSAMAEEGMTNEIGELCSNITAMLRYISSNKEPLVPLEDEIENTYRYINCLRLRFGQSLTYRIDIPDNMLWIPVPKLCVQLLVENAVKFTTPVPPPWHIEITASMKDSAWEVTVSDNGVGFSEEAQQLLDTKIQEIKKSKLLPSLELDGMGLLNIYIRLFLFSEGEHIFRFGNRAQGGAEVTIGGNIHD